MRIHTTVGVYNNDDYKINGVRESNLKDHVDYNLKWRPGRAFFLDGRCIHEGYLSAERCRQWEKRIAGNRAEFVKTIDTTPYV